MIVHTAVVVLMCSDEGPESRKYGILQYSPYTLQSTVYYELRVCTQSENLKKGIFISFTNIELSYIEKN